MFTTRRRVVSVVAAGLLAAAGVMVAAPGVAHACAMRSYRINGPAAAEPYLVAALRHFEKGEVDLAELQARRVLRVARITAAQRAQALTVSSWVAWQRGEKSGAVTTLRLARGLDKQGTAVDRVLDKASDRALTAALRRAAIG
jgi:hypothetical protein